MPDLPGSPRHGTIKKLMKPTAGASTTLDNNTNTTTTTTTTDSSNPIDGTLPETEDLDDVLFLPPGRIGVRSLLKHQSCGDSTPTRSRSRSPSMTRSTTLDGSISSMEECYNNIDSDLLTDRAGISDDLSESQRAVMLAMRLQQQTPTTQKQGFLTAVLERMTEDSLDDIHAFSDLTSTSARASVCSSNNNYNAGDGLQLEPLCEEEDEGEELDEEVAVTITNLENLRFKDDTEMILEEEEEGGHEDHEAADNDDDNDDDDDDAASNQAVAKHYDSLEQQQEDHNV